MGLQGITGSGTIIYKGKSSYEVVQKILDNIDSGIVVWATDSGEVLFENRIAARVPEIHRTIMDCIHNALESGDDRVELVHRWKDIIRNQVCGLR